MSANPINSIYMSPPNLPIAGDNRIAVLSSELETVDRLLVMGYLYCNNVQLVLRKNLIESEIEMLENARNKHSRPTRMFEQ